VAVDLELEFPHPADLVYLNHAAVAPWPRRARDAVARFADENLSEGARHYPRWLTVERRLREQLQVLINAPAAEDVALLKNTSEGLSLVAYGLPWQPGDNVVTSDQEFPSNRIVWESLARQGVALRRATLEGDDPEAALLALVDDRTRLLTISSVQYASGLRMDLERLGSACRERGVLFCVDAIQSVGALPMDVQAARIDFLVADGHKWMLGPEGLALFYCRPELRPRLALQQYGWHMVAHRGDYDRRDWEAAEDATRFECGSPNMLGIHALDASLSLLLEVGMDRVSAALLEKSAYLSERIAGLPGYRVVSATDAARRSGIVTFAREGIDPAALYRHLMDRGVVCAQRGGGVRFSPHFYTPVERLDRALELLAAYPG